MQGPATSLCKDYGCTLHLEEKRSSRPMFLNCSPPTIPMVALAHEMEDLRHMSFLNSASLEQPSTSISSHHTEAGITHCFIYMCPAYSMQGKVTG